MREWKLSGFHFIRGNGGVSYNAYAHSKIKQAESNFCLYHNNNIHFSVYSAGYVVVKTVKCINCSISLRIIIIQIASKHQCNSPLDKAM